GMPSTATDTIGLPGFVSSRRTCAPSSLSLVATRSSSAGAVPPSASRAPIAKTVCRVLMRSLRLGSRQASLCGHPAGPVRAGTTGCRVAEDHMSSIRLTSSERKALLDGYRRSNDPDIRLRAHILLLLAAGYPWVTISAVLFCSFSTIGRWKGRFDADGIDAIAGRARGRTMQELL